VSAQNAPGWVGPLLGKLNEVYTELVDTMEAGGLDQLNAAAKISWWQEFETLRNRLPLIDHTLIADAEATDLAGERCFSSLIFLLTRTLQLSHGEAASRGAGRCAARNPELQRRVNPKRLCCRS
jgi:hypothetical protein